MQASFLLFIFVITKTKCIMKRKTLLFLFIAIASSQIVQAQISKGDYFVGGQLGFAMLKNESSHIYQNNKQTNIIIAPALGFVTKDNVVWGFDIPVDIYKYEPAPATTTTRKWLSAGVGIFARKYFEIVDRFYLFGQGRFGASYISEKTSLEAARQKRTGFSVTLSLYPGISYAIKKNIHIESGFYNLGAIGYTRTKTTSTDLTVFDSGKSSAIGFSADIDNSTSFTVGIRFFVPGKSK
jgi:hypothetical protein